MDESVRHHRTLTAADLLNEIDFQTSRSGGPGGQNVNKVNTKVTLRFHIANSKILSEEEKTVLSEKLSSKITTEGEVVLMSQEKRSQLENKEAVLGKFDALIRKAFEKKKRRKKTKPSKGAKEKRIQSKKKISEKKQWRQKL